MSNATPSPAARYRELVMRHRRMLLRLCLKRAFGDPSEAADLYQEVALTLWRYMGTLLPDIPPRQERAYVRRAATFALNHCTRGKKPDLERLEAALAVALDETDHDNERLLDDLAAALPSEAERQAVALYRSGYTYDEVARIFGTTPNAVAQRIHRAVEHMQQIYEQEIQTINNLSNGNQKQ